MSRNAFAAVCGVLCAAIAALAVYGILDDNRTALLAAILLALPTLYVGTRSPAESR